MERKLTTGFKTLPLLHYKRETGKNILNIIQINPLDVDELLILVRLGNPVYDAEGKYVGLPSEEEACAILDLYFDLNPESSSLDAYFDWLEEYDNDRRDLKKSGVNIEDMKQRLMNSINMRASELTEGIEDKVSNEQEINHDTVD